MFEGFDPFEEADGTVLGKGRKRARLSDVKQWRITSRSPTPEVEEPKGASPVPSPEPVAQSRPIMTDEGCQTMDLEADDAAGTLADFSRQAVNVGSTSYTGVDEPIIPNILAQTLVTQIPVTYENVMPPPAIQTYFPEPEVESNNQQKPPLSPQLRPQPSESLPLVSPLVSKSLFGFSEPTRPFSSFVQPQTTNEPLPEPTQISAPQNSTLNGDEDIYSASPKRHVEAPVEEFSGFVDPLADANGSIAVGAEEHFGFEDQYGQWQRDNGDLSYVSSPYKQPDDQEHLEHTDEGERFYVEEGQETGQFPLEGGASHVQEPIHSQYPDLDDLSEQHSIPTWGGSSTVAYPDLPEQENEMDDTALINQQPPHSTEMSRSGSMQSQAVDLTESSDEEQEEAPLGYASEVEESEDSVISEEEEDQQIGPTHNQYFAQDNTRVPQDEYDDEEGSYDEEEYDEDENGNPIYPPDDNTIQNGYYEDEDEVSEGESEVYDEYEEGDENPQRPSVPQTPVVIDLLSSDDEDEPAPKQVTLPPKRPSPEPGLDSESQSEGQDEGDLYDKDEPAPQQAIPPPKQVAPEPDLDSESGSEEENERGLYDEDEPAPQQAILPPESVSPDPDLDSESQSEGEHKGDLYDEDEPAPQQAILPHKLVSTEPDLDTESQSENENERNIDEDMEDDQDIHRPEDSNVRTPSVELEREGSYESNEQESGSVGALVDLEEAGSGDSESDDDGRLAPESEADVAVSESKETATFEDWKPSGSFVMQDDYIPFGFDGTHDERMPAKSSNRASENEKLNVKQEIQLTENNGQLPTPNDTQQSDRILSTEAPFSTSQNANKTSFESQNTSIEASSEELKDETGEETKIEITEILTEIVVEEQAVSSPVFEDAMETIKNEDVTEEQELEDEQAVEEDVMEGSTIQEAAGDTLMEDNNEVVTEEFTEEIVTYEIVQEVLAPQHFVEEPALDNPRRSSRLVKSATLEPKENLQPSTPVKAAKGTQQGSPQPERSSPIVAIDELRSSQGHDASVEMALASHDSPVKKHNLRGSSVASNDTPTKPYNLRNVPTVEIVSQPKSHNLRKPANENEPPKHDLRREPVVEIEEEAPPKHNLRKQHVTENESPPPTHDLRQQPAIKVESPPPKHNLRKHHITEDEPPKHDLRKHHVDSTPSPKHDLRKHAVPEADTPTTKGHDLRKPPADLKLKLSRALRTQLAEFTALKVIRYHLNMKLEVMAVATTASSEPTRAKGAPKHFFTTFNITDVSIAPGAVTEVQVSRPYQKALPIVQAGDGVLLRNFMVVSLKNKGFGLRSTVEDSSWAVFHTDEEEPEICGPPVELGVKEKKHMGLLKDWYADLDATAMGKLDRANVDKANAA